MEEGSFFIFSVFYLNVFSIDSNDNKRFMPLNYWMTDYNTAE